jgi:hypothetical protein
MSTISFNFQDSHYIHSFENCIINIRKFYENELIDFFIDSNNKRLSEYETICKKYNVDLNIRNIHQGYIDREDSIDVNISKMLESHRRIYMTSLKSDSEWVLLLEDDILIKRKIKKWPSTDCGTNREYFKMGGGSIFRREKYIEAYESLGEIGLQQLIKQNHLLSWAGDELKRIMFDRINATSEKWIELAEPDYFDKTDHAVFHGYKDLHKLG